MVEVNVQKLRELRQRRVLTLHELEERSGVAYNTIWRLEMTSTNGHGSKRAILYARVSTDEQARSGYSLAQQMEALKAYAAQEGYEVLEEVTDPGQSGASLERPGMDQVR